MERTQEEIRQKIEWDHYAILQTAKREGVREGAREGIKKGRTEVKREVAKNLKQQGVSLEIIEAATNLSIEEIQKL
jgi:predicted transposase/invertase (TIGR01784 family)